MIERDTNSDRNNKIRNYSNDNENQDQEQVCDINMCIQDMIEWSHKSFKDNRPRARDFFSFLETPQKPMVKYKFVIEFTLLVRKILAQSKMAALKGAFSFLALYWEKMEGL